MTQLSNKIQIPIKTKIVAIFMVISAIFASIIFLLLVIYGFDGDFFRAVYGWWPLMIVIVGHILIANSLFNGKKSGWYGGLLMLCSLVCFFTYMALGPLFGYVNLRGAYTFLMLINTPFPIIILIDRKNYFAAVDKTKNKIN
jgi:hypothetical protein